MRSRIISGVGLGAVALVGAAAISPATAHVNRPSPSINRAAVVTATTTTTSTATTTRGMTRPSSGSCDYSQGTASDGTNVSTQNFEAKLDKFDDTAADDFPVPKGGCTVRTVQVKGSYWGPGGMQTATVTFYKDGGAKPGEVIKAKTGTVEQLGDLFTIELGTKGIKLVEGDTWMSVQANLDYSTGGQWYWRTVTDGAGDAGQWRNPGGGFRIPKCRDWCDATNAGAASPDFLFYLS